MNVQPEQYGEIMLKLGTIEAKVSDLAGNGQPGRVKLIENRVSELETNDRRRTFIEHAISVGAAFLVSVLIKLGWK